jgi:transcriptional regulator with XRE-family HTH domain
VPRKTDDAGRAVDRHVGSRIRLRRQLIGVTQEQLGAALGLTFQQVQKYERGVNRVSAGTLYLTAQALDVPVAFFFDGMDDGSPPVGGAARPALDPPATRMLRLVRAAPEPVVAEIAGLLGALAGETDADPDEA